MAEVDEACPVCFDLTPDRLAECGHTLCHVCASKWLARRAECPTCRRAVVPPRGAAASPSRPRAVWSPRPRHPRGVAVRSLRSREVRVPWQVRAHLDAVELVDGSDGRVRVRRRPRELERWLGAGDALEHVEYHPVVRAEDARRLWSDPTLALGVAYVVVGVLRG